jgi:hypothetical protein
VTTLTRFTRSSSGRKRFRQSPPWWRRPVPTRRGRRVSSVFESATSGHAPHRDGRWCPEASIVESNLFSEAITAFHRAGNVPQLVFDWDEQGWTSFVTDPEVPPILKDAGHLSKPQAAPSVGAFGA